MNFGLEQLRFKRVPYTPNHGMLILTDSWDDVVTADPEMAEYFVKACRVVLLKHGVGYGESASKKLLITECNAAGFMVQVPSVSLRYKTENLGARAIKGFSVEKRLGVKNSALQDRTTAADLARLISYMRKLNISHGALVNFGRTALTVRGVTQNKISHLH